METRDPDHHLSRRLQYEKPPEPGQENRDTAATPKGAPPSGDPAEQPATNSRFVLPFAYCLQPIRAADPEPAAFWKSIDPASLRASEHLDDYFSREITQVLYGRARWFEAAGPAVKRRQVRVDLRGKGNGKVMLAIEPPRMVLFECPPSHRGKSGHGKSQQRDPLLVGMIWFDIWFPNPANRSVSANDVAATGSTDNPSTEAENATPDFIDLLEVNELLRYFKEPFGKHAENRDYFGRLTGIIDHDLLGRPLDTTPGHADGVQNSKTGASASHPRAADYFRRWLAALRLPARIGDRWYALAPPEWFTASERWASNEPVQQPHLMVFPDNRAFVWTHAQLPGGASSLEPTLDATLASQSAGWIKLLNVDQVYDKTRPPWPKLLDWLKSATRFEHDWAADRTYRRWAHCGALYGFTPHSGVLVSSYCSEPPIGQHFREQYFDQTLLLLYLRTVMFRASYELSMLTGEARDENSVSRTADPRLIELNQRIADFVNLYQFPFLSHQQQGVEMYALQRRALDIDAFYDEIRQEIERSNVQLDLAHDREVREISRTLTVLGLPFAVLAGTGVLLGDLEGADWLGQLALRIGFTNQQWWMPPAVFGLLVTGAALLAVPKVLDKREQRTKIVVAGSNVGKAFLAIAAVLWTLQFAIR